MIYQIIAVLLLMAFYGCYFIKMIKQSRKGIQTDHMGKGKKGLIKYIEITLKIITILIVVLEVYSIACNRSSMPDWARWIGVLLVTLGVVTFICSVVTMKDSWRAGVPEEDKTELITTGIYEISRNPAFLGFDLVYIGICMMFFNWVLFATTVIAIVMLHLQIVNVEEDFLVEAFGEEYIEYGKKVNRYFGRKI